MPYKVAGTCAIVNSSRLSLNMVTDISLAAFGRKEIEIAEVRCAFSSFLLIGF